MEARAFLKNPSTRLLRGMHVDVASFGHATSNVESPDVRKLTGNQRQQLAGRLGSIAKTTHHSGQSRRSITGSRRFPRTRRFTYDADIRRVGSENGVTYGLGSKPDPAMARNIASFCLDKRLLDTLSEIANSKDRWASSSYVDFILTTANTWKTPIEDFTLIVERPHWKNNRGEPDLADYVSFCWDGPITKVDADRFSAHTVNLVPAKELRIGYFGVEHGRP